MKRSLATVLGLILLLVGIGASSFGFGIQEWGVGETGNHELQFQAGGITFAVVGLVIILLSMRRIVRRMWWRLWGAGNIHEKRVS